MSREVPVETRRALVVDGAVGRHGSDHRGEHPAEGRRVVALLRLRDRAGCHVPNLPGIAPGGDPRAPPCRLLAASELAEWRRRRQNTLGGTCSDGVSDQSSATNPALPVNLGGLSSVKESGMRFRRGLAGLAEPLPAEDARLGRRGLGLSRADHPPDRRTRGRGARILHPGPPWGVSTGTSLLMGLAVSCRAALTGSRVRSAH